MKFAPEIESRRGRRSYGRTAKVSPPRFSNLSPIGVTVEEFRALHHIQSGDRILFLGLLWEGPSAFCQMRVW